MCWYSSILLYPLKCPIKKKQTNKKQVDWDDMPGHINADSFTRITSVDCLFQIAELCNQFSQVQNYDKDKNKYKFINSLTSKYINKYWINLQGVEERR